MIIQHDTSWQMTLLESHSAGRSSGPMSFHLSEIIWDLYSRSFKGEKPDSKPIDAGYARRGFLFERTLSKGFAEELAQGALLSQQEICIEVVVGEDSLGRPIKVRIYMTPDGWLWEDCILHEYKATELSCKDLDKALESGNQGLAETVMLERHKTWVWQIMGYLQGLSATSKKQFTVCHLFVYWVRGNYKFDGPRGVENVRKYPITFTPEEIYRNWRMLANHARTMARERGWIAA